jgi:hypothetical protein
VPPRTPPVAVKTPVDGLNFSLVDDTLIGKFPVVEVTQERYISDAVVVSSVIATFVAFVAVVAVVADPAEPSMFTPVKDCALLDRFRAMAVVPM